MKLVKLLQSQGVGSRKECQNLITSGRVSLEGETLRNLAAEVDPQRGYSIDGEQFEYYEKLYIALNKPAGFECSHKPQHNRSVYELLPEYMHNRSVEAAGRLDADTTGLLLFSDDGQFIHNIMSPKKKCDKVYDVGVRHALTDEMVSALLEGVILNDSPEKISAIGAEAINEHTLRLTIKEGKYHQVKRMVAAVSNRVVSLRRISVGGLWLDSLLIEEGTYLILKKEHLFETDLYEKCTIRL